MRIIAKHFENQKGERGLWEVVEKKTPQQKAVCIFALTKDKEVIIEKIYRVPHECFVLEMPAGLCDSESEDLATAAKRELFEETGYQANEITKIYEATSDMSLTNLDVVYFFAPNVQYVGNNQGETAEEIEVLKIPLTQMVSVALNPPEGVKISYDFLALLPIIQEKKLIEDYK